MTGDLEPSQIFLSTLLPDRAQRRLAGAVALVSIAIFIALAPLAKLPLAPVIGFIPVYQSALAINDVGDDGIGFDLEHPRKPNSFGLVGLHERAHLIDGEITIDTAPGRGTRIDVRIPLPARPA
jgi:glucose-6-phosphate-specific signal transduction histidine kinase